MAGRRIAHPNRSLACDRRGRNGRPAPPAAAAAKLSALPLSRLSALPLPPSSDTSGPCPSIPLAHPPPARSRGIAFYPHRAASHSIIACLISFRITSSLRSAQTNRLESDGDSEHALYFSRDLTGLALPAPRPPRRLALARSPGRRQHKRRRAPPRSGHAWRRPGQAMRGGTATNTDSATYRRCTARLPGPRGRAAHSNGSRQLRRSAPASEPRLSLPSPGRGSADHSVGLLAQASCAGPSTPPAYESFTPRRAAGPGAHSVGQGRTLRLCSLPARAPSHTHTRRPVVMGRRLGWAA